MRLRYACFILICILILSLSGCQKEGNGEGVILSVFPLNGFGIQENQIVYFDNGLLEYEDVSVGKRVVLCSKANCKHEGYDYFSNPNPTCEAAAPQGCYYYQAAGIYDGYVYQLLDTENGNETIIYRSKINDAGRERVAVLPYTVSKEAGLYLYDGFIYMVGRYEKIEEATDAVGTESIELTLLRVDMKSGRVKELSNTFSDKKITQINKFYLDGDRLFFEYTHLKDGVTLEGEDVEKDWSQLLENELYYVDLDKEEKEQRVSAYDGEVTALLGVEDRQIYYSDEENIVKMDCDSGKKEVWLETGAVNRRMWCLDEQVIYERENGEIHYYNGNSGEDKVLHSVFPEKVVKNYVCIETAEVESEDGENITFSWMSFDTYLKTENAAKPEQETEPAQMEELQPTELTDELYEEKWKGKKQLVWINEGTADFDTDIIVRLNDILAERGYDFVIRYQEEDTYSEEFPERMKMARENGDAVDLFNIGGVYEGDNANRYEECVAAGLLCPWDAYLKTEEGKAVKATAPDPVWEKLRVDGHIYSYDWRTLPCRNLCGYVNREYARKYHITKDTTLQELKDIIRTIPDREVLQILWTDSDPAEAWGDEALTGFVSDSGIPIKQFYGAEAASASDFFMVIQAEDFVTAGENKIRFANQSCDIVKIKLADGKLQALTNNLLGIAAWSQNQEAAFTFITLVNTDCEIANLLQYGIEGRNYEVDAGVVKRLSRQTGLGEWTISNKRISLRQGLEPEGKEDFYKKYMDTLFDNCSVSQLPIDMLTK